jgi:hypothetical protein
MNSPLRRRFSAIATVCLACLLPGFTSVAGAATEKYPPDAAARGFNGGLAGWTGSSSFDGSCLPPLLCPSVTNSFQPSGGADGGGYVRSAYQGVAGAMAVAGTTTAVFTSPRFTYRGASGQAPTDVVFEMDRRASVDRLLAVSGSSATYSVRLVDVSAGGETSTLVAPTTLAGASSWRNAPRAPINPDRLAIGHDYRILITSTYVTGTSALVSGNADYDNVVLSAIREQRRKGGSGEGGAGATLSRQRLSDLVRAAQPDTAVLKGNGSRLFVRVKCPRKVGRTCRITAQGMLKKGKPATARRTVTLRKGKAKLLMLRVKPKARERVAKRKRLLVRHRVRAGKATATVYKRRKLIRRQGP